MISYCIAALLITATYTIIPAGATALLLLGFPVGFFLNGVFAGVGPLLSEMFPTHVRATCMGFSYNLGKSVGALAMIGVGILSEVVPLNQSIGAFCTAGYAMAGAALVFMRETIGTRFEDELGYSSDAVVESWQEAMSSIRTTRAQAKVQTP